ncbi:MAG: hypothetical protein PWQ39_402 [Thermacetogenium sp.]|nr:hypothetical protein [Thermacetogenium sp.]
MSLAETLCSARSRHILKYGEAVWYSWYSYPDGAKWIARYKDRYFHIIHDGTGNQFFCSHEPKEIDEGTGKEILSKHEKAWQEAREKWNWEPLDEYLAKVI